MRFDGIAIINNGSQGSDPGLLCAPHGSAVRGSCRRSCFWPRRQVIAAGVALRSLPEGLQSQIVPFNTCILVALVLLKGGSMRHTAPQAALAAGSRAHGHILEGGRSCGVRPPFPFHSTAGLVVVPAWTGSLWKAPPP